MVKCIRWQKAPKLLFLQNGIIFRWKSPSNAVSHSFASSAIDFDWLFQTIWAKPRSKHFKLSVFLVWSTELTVYWNKNLPENIWISYFDGLSEASNEKKWWSQTWSGVRWANKSWRTAARRAIWRQCNREKQIGFIASNSVIENSLNIRAQQWWINRKCATSCRNGKINRLAGPIFILRTK